MKDFYTTEIACSFQSVFPDLMHFFARNRERNEKEDGGRNLLAVENMTIQALKMIQKMQEQTNGLN